MQPRLNRRDVMKASAAAATGLYFGAAPDVTRADGPNEKLNIACIGVGGRGSANVSGVSSQNLVAFADVDDKRAAGTYKKYSKAKQYRDYRKLFDDFEGKLDAVVISTPDHAHFHPAYAAMQQGLHVYLEKPLAHNVWEIRTLTDYAREKKLATQLGSQRHAIGNMARVAELIQGGAIGPVTEVHSWVGGSRGMPKVPTEGQAVPGHLDYDLWVGPAKERPYHSSFCPYGWRFWWDYGTGETGNWGCHILDIPYWALDLKHCTGVEASGPEVDAERTPKSMHVKYKFPSRGDKPPVDLHWYHGTPPIVAEKKIPVGGCNTIFIGKEGMLVAGFSTRKLLPVEKFADYKAPEQTIPGSPGFYKEWINACRGGDPATCNFDYSGPMAESVILGNLAYRKGKFGWDAKQQKTVGNDEAQKMIRVEYRKGWEV